MICNVNVNQVTKQFSCEKTETQWEYKLGNNMQFAYESSSVPFECTPTAKQFGYRVICSCGNAVGDGSCLSDYAKTQNCKGINNEH